MRDSHEKKWTQERSSARSEAAIEHVLGRRVEETDLGTSGFALQLSEGRWLLVYLERQRLRWKTGKGSLAKALRKHGENPFCGDGYCPTRDRTPRAEDFCDLARELRRSHTARLHKLEFTAHHLDVVFRGGARLRAHIGRDALGRDVLRAFWEGRGNAQGAGAA